MSVIQINIDDKLAQTVGLKAIQEHIERQLSFLRIKYLGDKIAQTIKESGFDHAKEVQEAREEAWEEYKTKRELLKFCGQQHIETS